MTSRADSIVLSDINLNIAGHEVGGWDHLVFNVDVSHKYVISVYDKSRVISAEYIGFDDEYFYTKITYLMGSGRRTQNLTISAASYYLKDQVSSTPSIVVYEDGEAVTISGNPEPQSIPQSNKSYSDKTPDVSAITSHLDRTYGTGNYLLNSHLYGESKQVNAYFGKLKLTDNGYMLHYTDSELSGDYNGDSAPVPVSYRDANSLKWLSNNNGEYALLINSHDVTNDSLYRETLEIIRLDRIDDGTKYYFKIGSSLTASENKTSQRDEYIKYLNSASTNYNVEYRKIDYSTDPRGLEILNIDMSGYADQINKYILDYADKSNKYDIMYSDIDTKKVLLKDLTWMISTQFSSERYFIILDEDYGDLIISTNEELLGLIRNVYDTSR
jgi:hypothetical protein